MAKRSIKRYFSQNPTVHTNRTMFDMGNTDTVTINPDFCYPNYRLLILPGDTVSFGYSNYIRMLDPLQVPMMDNLYCDTLYFFVPFDNVWDYTYQFFGEQRRPSEPVISSLPVINFTAQTLPQVNSVYDYFDIPIAGTDNMLKGSFSIQALPLLSYYAIHDDWIRDEQRVDYLLDTPDFTAQTFTPDRFQLYKRGKRFDYFTSTILEPNMPSTSISLLGASPVYGNGYGMLFTSDDDSNLVYNPVYNTNNHGMYNLTTVIGNGAVGDINSSTSHPTTNTVLGLATRNQVGDYSPGTGLYADLSDSSSISIEQLRRAFQTQAYQEILMRYGTRFPEYLYSMYGVISDDLLNRRCEYLGMTHQRLTVQPIVQNSQSVENAPLGDLGGIVTGAVSDHVFTRSFTKFGYIIGIINIYADLTYYQGLDKDWSLVDRMDFPVNIFANLTDQPVYKKEIVLTGTATDDEVFGYNEIYSWAKYKKNTLRGLVRPNAPSTVGYWSLAQQFASVPVNDASFIQSNTDIGRITNVSSGVNAVHFIVNQKFDCKVTRELPAHSNPMKWMFRG